MKKTVKNMPFKQIAAVDGNGGAGGAGGKGGEGGAGCETIWGNKKPAGAHGEPGDEGSSGPKGVNTY